MVSMLKRALLWMLVAAAFAFLAISILPRIRYNWHCVIPDLFIITCICVGVCKGSLSGAIGGFMLGLLEGSLVGAYHGQYVMSRLAAGFAAGWAKEYMLQEDWLMASLCALAGSIACEVTMLMTTPQLLISFGRLDVSVITVAFAEVAYAVFIVPIVVMVISKLRLTFGERSKAAQAA